MRQLRVIRHGLGRHRRVRDVVVVLACVVTVAVLVTRARTTNAGRQTVQSAVGTGERYAELLDRTVATAAAESIRTGDAIAALYLQRLELGLGSPFRLIDQALRDPLLPASIRSVVGHALLVRTSHGDAFKVDPRALTLMSSVQRANWREALAHHDLIDSLVGSHADPRIGELTVRLAYRLAFAAGNVNRRAPEIAIQAAAQTRDRILASEDARQIIHRALATGTNALRLVEASRAERLFQVERPVLVQLTAKDEGVAVADLPAVVARIAQIAALAGDSSSDHAPHPTADGLARRMAGLAELRAGPPEAPIAVTVSGYGAVISAAGHASGQGEVSDRFVGRARNEESLAAEYALLRARLGAPTPEAAMAVLTAGVALRPYAQERAWLPGEGGPSGADLQTRYGFSAIEFDANVPQRWQPYYRGVLDEAIADMRRVFPAFDVTGLRVRFGESPLGDRALALHDPVSRTVFFPVTSGAGVMAHEFAHDLDWQAARRRYGATIGYRTDRALRHQADWLAGAVRRMASAPRAVVDANGTVRGSPSAAMERPTEVFARNVDWFVSAALARDERMNGYLTAAQDPVLTGYASATTPEAARDAGEATLRALDGISPPSPRLREWFDDRFGSRRKVSVHESVRRVLEVPLDPSDFRRHPTDPFAGIESARLMLRTVPSTASAWACVLDKVTGRAMDQGAARAVTQFAAESRARGIVQRWAMLGERVGPEAPWRLRALQGSPWASTVREDLTREIRDAILWKALGDPGTGEFPTHTSPRADAACGA